MPSSKHQLTGVFPPVVTPFTNDEPDLKALRSNLRKMSASDVTGYLALGSNGEFRSLSEKESQQIMEVFGEEKGDKALMVGTGCDSTSITIMHCRWAASHGADHASVITPSYFVKFVNDSVMLRYYTTVADASPIPIIVYNVPQFAAGIQISPKVIAELSKHPNIAGMKDSSPSGPARFLAALPGGTTFNVLSGSINTFYASLCLGASGGILSLANVIPDACVRLYRLFVEGDQAAARNLHVKLMRLNQAVSDRYGVAGVKAAMCLAGFTGGSPRLPLAQLTDEETDEIGRAFEAGGFPLT